MRIGAIYALEKLGNSNNDYYEPVVSILCSYVRENSPNPKSRVRRGDKLVKKLMKSGELEQTKQEIPQLSKDQHELIDKLQLAKLLREDVQVAMTVIGRIKRPESGGASFRLFCTNLSWGDFTRASLLRADLTDALFNNSDLIGADLRCAQLAYTNLTDADVDRADLRGAQGLTSDQLVQAKNWESAYRDPELACGANIPTPPETSDI